MVEPYFADEHVALYLGDFREVLPDLGVSADLIVADPPYGETSLVWDRWPDGWPEMLAAHGRSMWCFGSMRMFLDRGHEFRASGWRLSQDVVWEKHNGSSGAADRFNRVHEFATHWYQGDWRSVYAKVPVTLDATPRQVRRKGRPAHWGEIGEHTYRSEDGGPRLMRSVIYARSEHGRAINETQKPTGIVEPLIEYGCPPGGLVIDPFGGSASTLAAARALGRRGIAVEMREEQCEAAALRLSQGVLQIPGGAR